MDERDAKIAELLARARTGDASALGVLLDLHRDYLLGLAAKRLDRRGRARGDASDIVQQTCLSIHKRIAEFEGTDPAQFVAWLRRVHERNIENADRDQDAAKRAVEREVPLGERDVGGNQPTPSVIVSRDEERERLVAALARLPADEGEVLRLRYLDELTLVEIAERTGRTKDALVWLLKRAVKNLKRILTESEGRT